jgi:hypothetical protein
MATANRRLTKDLLFKYVSLIGHDKCNRCGEQIERKDFSIDHLDSWRLSPEPLEVYFNLDRIAFAHNRCNSLAGTEVRKKWPTIEAGKRAWEKENRVYCSTRRRKQYERTGK